MECFTYFLHLNKHLPVNWFSIRFYIKIEVFDIVYYLIDFSFHFPHSILILLAIDIWKS